MATEGNQNDLITDDAKADLITDEFMIQPKQTSFRLANKRILLTYKTWIDKTVYKQILKDSYDCKQVEIAHETGMSDPHTPYKHSHVYLEWDKPFTSKKASVFDIPGKSEEGKDIIIHPHIARVGGTVNDKSKVLNYLSKEDPECAHLKSSSRSIVTDIWNCESLGEAMLKAKKVSDANGIATIFKAKPRAEIESKEEEIKLNSWQKTIFDILKGPVNDRNIIWIYSTKGNYGKSFLGCYMEDYHKAIYRQSMNGMYHVSTSIKTQIDKGWDGNIIILDIPKCSDDIGKDTYNCLEQIKNGRFTTDKYEGGTCRLPSKCHLVIFANFAPNVQMMSIDRWKIYELSKNKTIGGETLYNINCVSPFDLLPNKMNYGEKLKAMEEYF